MTLMPPIPFKKRLNRVVAGAAILGSIMAMSMTSAHALETNAREAFIMDFDTGTVLLDKEGDTLTEPASMTKMMTVHMLFKHIKDGSVSMDDTFHVSEKAWRKGGSKMFVEVNSDVSVSDLLHGIIVQSGNDAAIVVAEGLAGTEDAFATEMTEEARNIGMTKSVFKNATGWPAEGHLVTVHDLATLARDTIRDFPELYKLYSVKEFTYNGIRQPNRNPLLGTSAGVDGLKTGHTETAGYGLTASAERDGRRLILVVNGLGSVRERRTESQKLLDWGFREFDNYDLFAKDETVGSANVWLGAETKVDLVSDKDILLTLPRSARNDMKVSVVYEGPIPAPITKGAQVASLKVEMADQETREFPLYAAHDVGRLGFIGRIGAAIKYLLWGANG
ncbi:D-Ala-D-Ala carboxypeptidase [Thalassospira lucentensis MCCC 1A00383 = DSM 14000]|jgi:D-alanyl-D-alanine carboxypeptidase (penicillin-binding protein 5/6)|uniref:serine-type D-Ala-D-Ala carboxypeptidase n=5 Tax=Thalassospiraceae TaxID=2844866 RepID=A0A358HS80_9PROT|nr:D-alanyl-D-alanine carboxypeptidase [Thalassospira sp.]RCK21736.1 D-Ala-D-Ala carboxypeptidase [Thalassospira lucentensis MCCC 1A00383 = DSM 14000]HBU97634.1 D-alanyl-D-alanine carboxypeptidase [Thalassospira lucentensis]|tara:strand:- start:114261 stop:115433 length:1173 start_codon:yes stop_codon:yes gene_type:complete